MSSQQEQELKVEEVEEVEEVNKGEVSLVTKEENADVKEEKEKEEVIEKKEEKETLDNKEGNNKDIEKKEKEVAVEDEANKEDSKEEKEELEENEIDENKQNNMERIEENEEEKNNQTKDTEEKERDDNDEKTSEEKKDDDDIEEKAPTELPKRELIYDGAWFEYLVGVPEPEFRKNVAKYIHPDQLYSESPTSKPVCTCDGLSITLGDINSSNTNQISAAGIFYFPTIADLRESASKCERKSVADKCVFYVDTNTTGAYSADVDICAMQANPENAGSLFQVASNLNTIESIDELTSPDSTETYVTDCIIILFIIYYLFYLLDLNDRTQGPFASISAAPGSIMRVYGMFYDSKTSPESWMQTKNKCISMVEDIKDYYTVYNGYIMNNGSESFLHEFKIDEVLENVRIGIQQDVDVVFGKRTGRFMEVLSPRHRISQAFCAGMNLSQGSSGRKNSNLKGSREKAVLMLRASYIGAYLAAVVLKCPKLFLTFVGGGVFGNSMDIIINELIYAHRLIALSPLNKTVTEVHLSIFSKGGPLANRLFDKLIENGIKFRSNEGLIEPFEPDTLPPPPTQSPSYKPEGFLKTFDGIKKSIKSGLFSAFKK